jgi:hypothetical protein
MDGFITLMTEIVRANGLKDAEIRLDRTALTLPGYFRPTKLWDMLVEDAPGSRSPVRDAAPHFPIFPEVREACYHVLCRKLMRESLYTSAASLAS